MKWNQLLLVILLCFIGSGRADTFTNKKTGEQFEGYAVKTGQRVAVRNAAKEEIRYIDPANYEITYSPAGRRNQIFVFDINFPLLLECQTQAFEQAIKTSEIQGPLAVVIKLDTPGGRVDLMKRYCSAIASVDITPVIGIVCSGRNGGVYSAGAVIAMGCDKLYMEENSAIGAATLVVVDVNDGLKSAKDKFGRDIGEKMDSAHRAYCVSVAEQAGRSGLIAQAMVDRQTEVLAVKTDDGKIEICDGSPKSGKEVIVINPKGSLLTLSAQRAAEIGFSDGVIENFNVWKQGTYSGSKFIPRQEVQSALRQYQIYEKQMDNAFRTIDQLIDKVNLTSSKVVHYRYEYERRELTAKRRADLRQAIGSMIYQFKQVVALKKKCDDLPVELDEVVSAVDHLTVLYNELKEQ